MMHIARECRNYIVLNYTEHDSGGEVDNSNRTGDSKKYSLRKERTNGGVVNVIRVDGIKRLRTTNFNFKSVWGPRSLLKITVEGHGAQGTFALMGANPDRSDRPFVQVARDIGYVYEQAVGYHTILKPKVKISLVVCHAARPRNWVMSSPNDSLEDCPLNRGPSFLTYLASAVARFIPTFSIKGYFTAVSLNTPTDTDLRSKIVGETIIGQHNRHCYDESRIQSRSILSSHQFEKYCTSNYKGYLCKDIRQILNERGDHTLDGVLTLLYQCYREDEGFISKNKAWIDSYRKEALKQIDIVDERHARCQPQKAHLAHKLSYYNGLLVSDNYTSVINSAWGK